MTTTQEEGKEEQLPPAPPLRSLRRRLLKYVLPVTLISLIILSSTELMPVGDRWLLLAAIAAGLQVVGQLVAEVLQNRKPLKFSGSFSFQIGSGAQDDKKLKVIK